MPGLPAASQTPRAVLNGQKQKPDESLLVALRVLEERRNMLISMLEKDRQFSRSRSANTYEEKIIQTELREVILSNNQS